MFSGFFHSAAAKAALVLSILLLQPLRADIGQLARDVDILTAGPHRLSGSDEYMAAARHVEERLREAGVDQVLTQDFTLTGSRIKRCEIILPDRDEPLSLLPMRPNGIIHPVTPPEGIRAPIVHAGSGTPQDYAENDVEGAIAVLDYNSGEGWLNAFAFGARAVVFVNNDLPRASEAHFVNVNANLPRFYYSGQRADLPQGSEAIIHSQIQWEPARGRNVFGYIKGTDPVFEHRADELMILAAPLDSFGEVPALSPGARGAANCAALLQIGRHLAANRPKRNILLAFFDMQSRGHYGASMFYRALESDFRNVRIEDRREFMQEETDFLHTVRDLLESDTPFYMMDPFEEGRRQLLVRIRERSREEAYEIADEMRILNRESELLRRLRMRDQLSPEQKARYRELDEIINHQLQPKRDAWNSLRRLVGREMRRIRSVVEAPELDDQTRQYMADTLHIVREDIEFRLQELELEARSIADDQAIVDLIGEQWIVLHASLLLGDATPSWGLAIGGESALRSGNDNPGLYGRIQTTFLRTHRHLAQTGDAPANFVTASADGSIESTRSLWSAPHMIHSGEISGLFGIYNLALVTSQERTPLEGTPADTADRINLERIGNQGDEIARLLAGPEGVASNRGLSLRRGIVSRQHYVGHTFQRGTATGASVMGMIKGNPVPNTPMVGAVVHFDPRPSRDLSYNPVKPYAFEQGQVVMADGNGLYRLGPTQGAWSTYGAFAAVFDETGFPIYASGMDSYPRIRDRINVFEVNPGAVIIPPQVNPGRGPSEPIALLSAHSHGRLDENRHFRMAADGVFSFFTEEREDGVKFFTSITMRNIMGLNNGPITLEEGTRPKTDEEAYGTGFAMHGGLLAGQMSSRSATDLWRLNEYRLGILRNNNILESSLEELHGKAEDILLTAVETDNPISRHALSTSAFWASQPVYRRTRESLDDLVFAVLILLGLSIPFAFAIERVVIGATTVYKQILGFAGIFMATFLILYFSHPAFEVANTPIIIFLGFAVVTISVMVISLIMRKFEVELKALQGMRSTVHAIDVSRVSTFVAAMQMGISTMRRRPLRTALTATTIVLLTFTILFFASFTTQVGIVRIFSAPVPDYSGVWVHDINWRQLSPDVASVIESRWTDNETGVYLRRWISPASLTDPGNLVSLEDGATMTSVDAVLGISPDEVKRRSDLRELFHELDDDTVLLTAAVASSLDVGPGDRILLRGLPLTVGPLMDAVAVSAARDMDASSILPVDFREVESEHVDAEEMEAAAMEQRSWTTVPVDSVVVLSERTARSLGARIHGISIFTEETTKAVEIAEDMTRMLAMPVAATRANGVFLHLLGTVLSASGAADLFFPILLGGLVVFGTMLGSVSDREREIYTFSALGLAPRHVATLFFAESMVYSIIGGMGGYLLAQAAIKLLTIMAGHGLVTVPDVNMSSTNTIVTILIVMATVLISAIYPAFKASGSANPGLMRIWRPPSPQGDVMDMVFPFTVSEYDITGVVSFLKEHFDNFSDTGMGQFMARNTKLVRTKDGMLGLDSDLSLAPFDLGVSQSFAMRSTPSEIPGIDEVRIRLDRLSGQPKDWQRLNKVFLDDIRQQLLIWRSLPQASMELYRERTLVSLGEAQPAKNA